MDESAPGGKLKSRKAGVNVLNSVRKFIGGIEVQDKPIKQALPWRKGSLLEEVQYREGLYQAAFSAVGIKTPGYGDCFILGPIQCSGLVFQDIAKFGEKLKRELIISGAFRPDTQAFFAALPQNKAEYFNTDVFDVLARQLNVKIKTIHKVEGTDDLVFTPDFWINDSPGTTPIWIIIDEPGVHCTTVMPNDFRNYRWVSNSMLDNIEEPIRFLRDRLEEVAYSEANINYEENRISPNAWSHFDGFKCLQENQEGSMRLRKLVNSGEYLRDDGRKLDDF
jgi:hypothetical protein